MLSIGMREDRVGRGDVGLVANGVVCIIARENALQDMCNT